jgi:hypothetical protein
MKIPAGTTAYIGAPPSSAWFCGHGGTMSCCCLPIFDPLLSNTAGLLDELDARALRMLDHYDDPGVEFPLGVINIG